MAALGVCWHVPGQEEENFVFQLLSRLLRPELQRIEAHVSGEQPMSRCAVAFLFLSSWLSFFNTQSGNQADVQTQQSRPHQPFITDEYNFLFFFFFLHSKVKL